jgi:hypothetical protein
MSQKDDGGPVFPSSAPFEMRVNGETHRFQGMTLRQWYAGMVLQGLLINCFKETKSKPVEYVNAAFQFADLMLAKEAE